MSDHTHDPIRDLENFGTGGISVNPLDPAAVRRLGDKRRSQHRVSILIAASAFAVIGAIIPVTLAMTNDGGSPGPPMNTLTPTPTPTPTPTRAALGLGNIPPAFPLDLDAIDYTGDGGEIRGPDATVETPTPVLCDADPITEATAVGRMGFASSGPEISDDRELRTFPKVAAATAVMSSLRNQLDTCPSWEGETVPLKVTVLTADTGQDSVTFAVTEDPPAGLGYAAGGSVYQITRVGSAILTLGKHGEDSPATAPTTAKALTTVTGKLAPEMCLFTAEGCRSTELPSDDVRTFTYPGGAGVEVAEPADAELLRGSSEAFQQFILSLADPEEGAVNCAPGASVMRYSTAGYAIGVPGGCSTMSVAIWAIRAGTWKQVLLIEDWLMGTWNCSDLAREGIPRSFVGGCRETDSRKFDREGDFGPVYVDGIRLHMTEEEVKAAGGSVRWPDGRQFCGHFYLPGLTPGTDDSSGAISDRGVVSINPVTFPGDGIDSVQRMLTPEGVGLNTSRADVEAAYPDGTDMVIRGAWTVPLAQKARYRFDFNEYDEVVGLRIETTDQNCYE